MAYVSVLFYSRKSGLPKSDHEAYSGRPYIYETGIENLKKGDFVSIEVGRTLQAVMVHDVDLDKPGFTCNRILGRATPQMLEG